MKKNLLVLAVFSMIGMGLATIPVLSQGSYTCNGLTATIVGTDTDNADNDGSSQHGVDDYLVGTHRADVIVGLGGDDDIRAGKGADTICSGAGVDEVYGMNGNDWIDCGADNDSCHGDGGSDTMCLGGTTLPYNGPCSYTAAGCSDGVSCSACDALRFGNFGHSDTQAAIDNDDYGFHPEDDGPDYVHGGDGKEVLFTLGGGNDTFWGGGGNDGGEYRTGYIGYITGDAGADTFYGGDGIDQEFHGYAGDDYLEGGQGMDDLHGGNGTDEVRGEYDNDDVYGGPGNSDQVHGGPGAADAGGGGPGTSDTSFSIEYSWGDDLDDDRKPSYTMLTNRIRNGRIHVNGRLSPAHKGRRMTVTLKKGSDGRWVKVRTKRPLLGAGVDVSGDSVLDSKYSTRFRNPKNAKRCRVIARFAGDLHHFPSKARRTFHC
jgi:hypothetical protein